MAQRTPEEEKEQQGTVRERMRDSLRKGVDSRREGREQRSTARKEKRSERQETRQQRKPERQEERTAGKLAYSEAREQGQGVVPAMRQRRQEKMRQRLANLRSREQQPDPQQQIKLGGPSSLGQGERDYALSEVIETRAYPQRIFGAQPAARTHEPSRSRGRSAAEMAGDAAQREHELRTLRAQGPSDMTPEQIAEMEAEVARTSKPGNHPAHQYGMSRQPGEPPYRRKF